MMCREGRDIKDIKPSQRRQPVQLLLFRKPLISSSGKSWIASPKPLPSSLMRPPVLWHCFRMARRHQNHGVDKDCHTGWAQRVSQ